MLRFAIFFLVIAMIAALFGFTGVAGVAWDGFRVLTFVFLALAIISFLVGGYRTEPPA